jgi:glycogen debranching enzyme
LKTAPHLRSALELDDALLDMSENMASIGLGVSLNCEADLDRSMDHIKE